MEFEPRTGAGCPVRFRLAMSGSRRSKVLDSLADSVTGQPVKSRVGSWFTLAADGEGRGDQDGRRHQDEDDGVSHVNRSCVDGPD